jgi:hypothetical protein
VATLVALSLMMLFVLACRRRDVSVRVQLLPSVRIEIDARAACCRSGDARPGEVPDLVDALPELENQ